MDAPGRIGFVSLGCPKNTVDSERILTQLRAEGYDITPTYQDADVVIVNTCGFIDSAVHYYAPKNKQTALLGPVLCT